MNIKQSIFTLLLLMGVSFSALAYDSITNDFGYNSFKLDTSETCLGSKGSVFDSIEPIGSCFEGEAWHYGSTLYGCYPLYNDRNEAYIMCKYNFSGVKTSKLAIFKATAEPPPPPCSALEGEDAPWPVGPRPNDDKPVSAVRLFCDTQKLCTAKAGYTAYNSTLGPVIVKESYYTGSKCSDDFTGNENCQYLGTTCDAPLPPEPELEDPYPGCKKPYVESPFVCPEDTDGDGIPNPDAPFDEGANCSHDASGKFSCTGGTFDPETPNPDPDPNPEPNPDPTVPDDPTNGINDPSPLDPINTTPINPNPTDPEEDVEPVPDSGNGNGDIVTAITNQNRDINSSLHSLNVANNKNFAEVNTKLNQLDNNTKAINKNIGLQLKQDIEIYEQNKKLQLQATQETSRLLQQSDTLRGTQIGNQTSALTGAIGGQTTALKGAIDGQTEAITGALDGLEGAIDKLTDKIPEPCEPTLDNNYCENPHGLTAEHTNSVFNQVIESFDGAISIAQSTMSNQIEQATNDHIVDKDTFLPFVDKIVGFIPLDSSCQPLDAFGYKLKCEPFVVFKEIFGFFLFMLTGMFLIDVILYDFAPNALGRRS